MQSRRCMLVRRRASAIQLCVHMWPSPERAIGAPEVPAPPGEGVGLPACGELPPLEPCSCPCCWLLAAAAAARPSAAKATTPPAMLLLGALVVGACATEAIGPCTVWEAFMQWELNLAHISCCLCNDLKPLNARLFRLSL